MRNMLSTELNFIFKDIKPTRKDLGKLEKKNYFVSINPYTYIYTNYYLLKERNKMSSKYNSSNNNLFLMVNNNYLSLTKKVYEIISKPTKIKNEDISYYLKKSKYFKNYNYEKEENVEKEIILNETKNDNNEYCANDSMFIEKEQDDEELYYKNKIIEIKNKRSKKGLTSLCINKNQSKILVNSMSNTQYIYDSIFLDIKPPLEIKGHESSYYVKSVLSPCGRYVLSGSNSTSIYIWDLHNKDIPLKLENYHNSSINAVDWGKTMNNFISTGCDGEMIIIWDNKKDY